MAELRARISLDSSQFSSGLNAVRSSIGSLASYVTGALSLGAVIAFAKSAASSAIEINDVSKRLGISTDLAQQLRFAAEQLDSDFQSVAKSSGLLLKNLGESSPEMAKALQTLGINSEMVNRQNIGEILLQISKAMQESGGSALTLNASTKLLGKGAQELWAILREGPEAIQKAFGEAPINTKEQIAAIDSLSDANKKFWSEVKAGGIVVLSYLERVRQGFQFSAKLLKTLNPADMVEPAAGLSVDTPAINASNEMAELTDATTAAEEKRLRALETEQETYDRITARLTEIFKIQESLSRISGGPEAGKRELENAQLALEAQKLLAERDKAGQAISKEPRSERDKLAEKLKQNFLAGLSTEDRITALENERLELAKKITAETDKQVRLKLQLKDADLAGDIGALKRGREKPAAPSFDVDRLQRIGGFTGTGNQTGIMDATRQVAKNTAAILAQLARGLIINRIPAQPIVN